MLRRWIDAGAKVPADSVGGSEAKQALGVSAAGRPPLPSVRDAAWPAGPIDTFILAPAGNESGLLRRAKPSGQR